MKLGSIVTASFFASFVIGCIAVYLRLSHSETAEPWLYICMGAFIVFVATAIYEVRTSTRINQTEKMLWTLAFLFFSGLTGLIYILIGRKRITSHS